LAGSRPGRILYGKTQAKMKKLFFLWLWLPVWGIAQIPDYYDDVDLTKTGMDLFDELSVKIISTHNYTVSYSELWDILAQTDYVSEDTSKVFLIYGWEQGNDDDCHNDIMRDKDQHGGSSANCEWNREHVFPRSLADPELTNTGAGADPLHVRPSDISMNGTRGNKKFMDASGRAGVVNQNYWYPGDQWKGDVARIIMYLYLRYGSQCLPIYVGEGLTLSIDPNMVDVFLRWNAEDPPSPLELQRNEEVMQIQGNRNPFVDNPYLATLIWGGPEATDTWNLSVEHLHTHVSFWPNPVEDYFYAQSEGEELFFTLTDSEGRIIRTEYGEAVKWNISELPAGIYYLQVRENKDFWVMPVIKN